MKKRPIVESMCRRCLKKYKTPLICKVFGQDVVAPHDCKEQKEWDKEYDKRRILINNKLMGDKAKTK